MTPHDAETDKALAIVPEPDYLAMPQLARGAVAIALYEHSRGVREEPPGSNRGLDVDRYLRGRRGDGAWLLTLHGTKGAPWCARFALFCVETAAADLKIVPPTEGAGGLASALKWRDWAQRVGRWRETPSPGSVGVLLGKTMAGHVCLVLRVDGETVTSVDGNVNHRVSVVARPASAYAGFVDLA